MPQPTIQPFGCVGNWVEPYYFRKKVSTFGYYACKACSKVWISAYTLKGYRQKCIKCRAYVRASYYWLNSAQGSGQRRTVPDNKKPHMYWLCQACKYGVCRALKNNRTRNESRRTYRALSRSSRANQLFQGHNFRDQSQPSNRGNQPNRSIYVSANRHENQPMNRQRNPPTNNLRNGSNRLGQSIRRSNHHSRSNYYSRYAPSPALRDSSRQPIQYQRNHLSSAPQIISSRLQSRPSNAPR